MRSTTGNRKNRIRMKSPVGTFAPMLLALLAIVAIAGSGSAAPPHPDLVDRARSASTEDGATAIVLPDPDHMHQRGICTADDPYFTRYLASKQAGQRAAQAEGFKVLALLVDFSDNQAAVAPAFYDSLVFGSGTGTIADYLSEISYGQVDLITDDLPSTIGWTRAPQPYSYYVNGEQGMGGYPQNSQKLVEDLVDAVDGQVDFSNYDNDGDGYVDVLLVIHAGSGAELTGSPDDIWSHKWAIPSRQKDGVRVSSFTVQPEFWVSPGDMTIGVYAHELCHGFGLPDLYDTDYSSKGVGAWCLMSFGAWNGNRGDSPSHPSAWCRIAMGFASPQQVQQNVSQEAIVAVETQPDIYRLDLTATEYYLVENRQRTGYDAALPGDGLLIWHVDDAKGGNTTEWYPGQPASNHFLVALEQADNDFALEHNIGYGDGSDPFPGSTDNRTFDSASAPAATSYSSDSLFVGITNISSSATTMYADLRVDTSSIITGHDGEPKPPLPVSFELAQNYPNPFNPSTTIQFDLDESAEIKLTVYNSLGQKVRTLVEGTYPAGITDVVWDATDKDGQSVASGVYLYRMTV
ncbi:M6 family metalloprotease domain-containing protein, partial [candidate division GN15 bacterium]|nr:M6 family metalloprotease domain-containing protein [candidate division GN15 bacterium]